MPRASLQVLLLQVQMSSSSFCLALSTAKVHQRSELTQVNLHLQAFMGVFIKPCRQGAMTSLAHPWNGAGLLEPRRPAVGAVGSLHCCISADALSQR